MKAVFLDRDGVINEEVKFLSTPKEFELLPNSAKAIKILNENNWLVILITNQPVIARGEASRKDVNKIHEKMKEKIKIAKAHVDGIYYCPHHPDKGFEGERSEYKIKCECRKPKIGLIKKAQDDFDIDLENSFFIGDKTVDIKTGKNAGCKTILVKTGYGGSDNKYNVTPDFVCEDLLGAVKLIIGERK